MDSSVIICGDKTRETKWLDMGYWLSSSSNKRHNRNCENYRKTRGYPCSKSDGTPCGKCEG